LKRSKLLAALSIVLTTVLFVVYRSPPVLYIGLVYAGAIMLSENQLVEKTRPDVWSVAGALMIAASPIFLAVKFGGYPSPSIFQSLVLIGASFILFTPKSTVVPNTITAFGIAIAIGARTGYISAIIVRLSDFFVEITSYMVNSVLTYFNVPISMNGNVATVKENIVVIGSGCSGFNAFVLYITASLLLIYLTKADRKTALLLLLGGVWIIPLNSARILILLLIGYHSGISFLRLFHSHLGDMMFVGYVFAYWWLILRRSKRRGETAGGEST